MNLILFKQLRSAQTEKMEDPLALLVLQGIGSTAAALLVLEVIWEADFFHKHISIIL